MRHRFDSLQPIVEGRLIELPFAIGCIFIK